LSIISIVPVIEVTDKSANAVSFLLNCNMSLFVLKFLEIDL
jgi:hypothetical protein